MGFLLFMIFLLFMVNLFTRASRAQQQKAKADFVVEDVAKNCPPHKWRYIEVRDLDGKAVKWRLTCDLCGPPKSAGGPVKLE